MTLGSQWFSPKVQDGALELVVESAASQRHVEYFLVRLLPISELRVDLRGPLCGASDVQMVPGAEP